MLNDATMLSVRTQFPDPGSFGEIGQTFYVTQTSSGVFNGGLGGYSAMHEGMPEWGFNHEETPARDSVNWESYRLCCTGVVWGALALSARMMSVSAPSVSSIQAWNHPAFFDYVDRFMIPPAAVVTPYTNPYLQLLAFFGLTNSPGTAPKEGWFPAPPSVGHAEWSSYRPSAFHTAYWNAYRQLY